MTALERIKEIELDALNPDKLFTGIDEDHEFLLKAYNVVRKIYLDERSNGRYTEETLNEKFELLMSQ